jgi:hypothetical protein
MAQSPKQWFLMGLHFESLTSPVYSQCLRNPADKKPLRKKKTSIFLANRIIPASQALRPFSPRGHCRKAPIWMIKQAKVSQDQSGNTLIIFIKCVITTLIYYDKEQYVRVVQTGRVCHVS